MGVVEELILRYPCRGMDILQPYMPQDFCQEAAELILSWPRGGTVLLTTGFYVAGHAETDGPPGTLLLAKALQMLGFCPVVVTDGLCRGYFERGGIPCTYVEPATDEGELAALLRELAPVGLISVERCGRNEDGEYLNMCGISIAEHTAPIDRLFDLADVPSVGIGDGGNEIGMGNLAEQIRKELALIPCRVTVDKLVIATVSNWGALGLCACLGALPAAAEVEEAYLLAQELGFVDGVIRECVLGEDGFALDVVRALYRELVDAPVVCRQS
ncbi:MAG: DUF4392 domain-containing protein [Ruminococcaceae bacterium]|nr:DUF4392 domain-containing protein [Oscillospiraceae bacterium]